MTISPSLVPPGGWYFEEPPITIRAATYPKLVELVVAHRASNNRPPGDPGKEIMAQIGGRHPHLNLQRQPSLPQQAMNFAYALKKYVQGGGALVDQNTANIRAEVCTGCHNNHGGVGRNVAAKTCGACGKAAHAMLASLKKMILNGRATPHDDLLHACDLCGCDLSLKVWFPKEYFNPKGDESNKYPTFCWLK